MPVEPEVNKIATVASLAIPGIAVQGRRGRSANLGNSSPGKPAGSDAEQGKNTYPALVGLDESRRLAREQADAACAALAGFSGPEAEFLRALAEYTITRAA